MDINEEARGKENGGCFLSVLRYCYKPYDIKKSINCFVVLSPSATLRQGNVFTSVCHSVHRGDSLGRPPPEQTPPADIPPGRQPPGQTPPGRYPLPPADGYCSRCYTFLFCNVSTLQWRIQDFPDGEGGAHS